MQEYASSQVEELMCEVNEEQELEAALDEEEDVRKADRLLELESARDPAWEWIPHLGPCIFFYLGLSHTNVTIQMEGSGT